MTEEIAKYGRQEQSPAMMMMIAIEKGLDLEKVEKAMLLQEAWERRQAEKAYVVAMAEFKKNPPEILKTKPVQYRTKSGGIVKWDQAVLGEVAEAINRGLSEHGLYAMWSPKITDTKIEVTCKITHEQGHIETIMIQGAPDKSGDKDDLKAMASTITFLERLTLLAITGLAAKGMDDESNLGEQANITSEQAEILKKLIVEKEANEKAFLLYIGENIKSVETIPTSLFQKALTALKEKKKPAKKGVISEQELKKLFAMAHEFGLPEDVLKKHVIEAYGIKSRKEIPSEKVNELFKWVENYKKPEQQPGILCPVDNTFVGLAKCQECETKGKCQTYEEYFR